MLDNLETFRPESEPEIHEPTHRGESITITELVASAVVIHWYEAVAISQAICDTLRLAGDDPRPVRIGPEHVSITGTGGVHLSAKRTRDGRSALDEVSGLLREMLGEQDIPTPLRLALSQTAVSNSLEQWSNTIAYYERPNRAELIQALYERARTGSPLPAAAMAVVAVPASLASTPHPPAPSVSQDSRRVQRSQRKATLIGVAVGVAVVAAAAVWLLQIRRSSTPTLATMADPIVEISPPTQSSVSSVVESLVNRIPMIGRNVIELQPAAPPEPPPGRWIHLPSDRRPGVQSKALPVTQSVPISIPSVARETGNTSVSASVARLNNTIYSAADHDVVPPVAVYPQFPSIPAGTHAGDVAEFDVIVSASGDVESVRARRAPASLAEALTVTMSLSAAKSWRFRPGFLNGEPIRYRHVISILKNR